MKKYVLFFIFSLVLILPNFAFAMLTPVSSISDNILQSNVHMSMTKGQYFGSLSIRTAAHRILILDYKLKNSSPNNDCRIMTNIVGGSFFYISTRCLDTLINICGNQIIRQGVFELYNFNTMYNLFSNRSVYQCLVKDKATCAQMTLARNIELVEIYGDVENLIGEKEH